MQQSNLQIQQHQFLQQQQSLSIQDLFTNNILSQQNFDFQLQGKQTGQHKTTSQSGSRKDYGIPLKSSQTKLQHLQQIQAIESNNNVKKLTGQNVIPTANVKNNNNLVYQGWQQNSYTNILQTSNVSNDQNSGNNYNFLVKSLKIPLSNSNNDFQSQTNSTATQKPTQSNSPTRQSKSQNLRNRSLNQSRYISLVKIKKTEEASTQVLSQNERITISGHQIQIGDQQQSPTKSLYKLQNKHQMDQNTYNQYIVERPDSQLLDVQLLEEKFQLYKGDKQQQQINETLESRLAKQQSIVSLRNDGELSSPNIIESKYNQKTMKDFQMTIKPQDIHNDEYPDTFTSKANHENQQQQQIIYSKHENIQQQTPQNIHIKQVIQDNSQYNSQSFMKQQQNQTEEYKYLYQSIQRPSQLRNYSQIELQQQNQQQIEDLIQTDEGEIKMFDSHQLNQDLKEDKDRDYQQVQLEDGEEGQDNQIQIKIEQMRVKLEKIQKEQNYSNQHNLKRNLSQTLHQYNQSYLQGMKSQDKYTLKNWKYSLVVQQPDQSHRQALSNYSYRDKLEYMNEYKKQLQFHQKAKTLKREINQMINQQEQSESIEFINRTNGGGGITGISITQRDGSQNGKRVQQQILRKNQSQERLLLSINQSNNPEIPKIDDESEKTKIEETQSLKTIAPKHSRHKSQEQPGVRKIKDQDQNQKLVKNLSFLQQINSSNARALYRQIYFQHQKRKLKELQAFSKCKSLTDLTSKSFNNTLQNTLYGYAQQQQQQLQQFESITINTMNPNKLKDVKFQTGLEKYNQHNKTLQNLKDAEQVNNIQKRFEQKYLNHTQKIQSQRIEQTIHDQDLQLTKDNKSQEQDNSPLRNLMIRHSRNKTLDSMQQKSLQALFDPEQMNNFQRDFKILISSQSKNAYHGKQEDQIQSHSLQKIQSQKINQQETQESIFNNERQQELQKELYDEILKAQKSHQNISESNYPQIKQQILQKSNSSNILNQTSTSFRKQVIAKINNKHYQNKRYMDPSMNHQVHKQALESALRDIQPLIPYQRVSTNMSLLNHSGLDNSDNPSSRVNSARRNQQHSVIRHTLVNNKLIHQSNINMTKTQNFRIQALPIENLNKSNNM
eukprot:403339868